MEINKQIQKIIKERGKLLKFRENIEIQKKTRVNMEKWLQKKIELNIQTESLRDKIWRWVK